MEEYALLIKAITARLLEEAIHERGIFSNLSSSVRPMIVIEENNNIEFEIQKTRA